MPAQSLSRSVAQSLSRSVAQSLSRSVASRSWLPIVALVSLSPAVVFLASGCQSSSTAERTANSAHADQLEFDAGVIFAGETNYLCIPFERIGLDSFAQITSIETSCECVRGSVVSYRMPNKSMAHAVRLDFAPEPRSKNSEFIPMLLSVKVEIAMVGMEEKQAFVVDLVYSTSPVVAGRWGGMEMAVAR